MSTSSLDDVSIQRYETTTSEPGSTRSVAGRAGFCQSYSMNGDDNSRQVARHIDTKQFPAPWNVGILMGCHAAARSSLPAPDASIPADVTVDFDKGRVGEHYCRLRSRSPSGRRKRSHRVCLRNACGEGYKINRIGLFDGHEKFLEVDA
jgi:hypothetical protein